MRLPLLTLCAAIALGCPVVLAQSSEAEETEPFVEDPPAGEDGQAGSTDGSDLDSATRELELSVQSAVAIALVNDIGLQVEGLASEVARFDALGSWGAFDWVFTAEGNYIDGKQKGDTDLSGAEILKFDTIGWGLDLNRPLEWGGDIGVRLDSDTTETNNAFARANPSTTDVLALSYRQPLLRGFGTDHGTADQRAADVNYSRQLHRAREVRQDVERRVRDAYWDLVLVIEQLDVAEKGLDLVTEQLARERRRVEVGVGTEVEVLEAEAQVAIREEAVLQADVNVRAAEDALKQILFPGTDRDVWETRITPQTPLPETTDSDGLAPWTETFTNPRPPSPAHPPRSV